MSQSNRKSFMDWWYSSPQQAANPEQRATAEAAWDAALTAAQHVVAAAWNTDPRFKIAAHAVFDEQLYDIAEPVYPVEVRISSSNDQDQCTVWVNIGPICVLRIGRAPIPITFNRT